MGAIATFSRAEWFFEYNQPTKRSYLKKKYKTNEDSNEHSWLQIIFDKSQTSSILTETVILIETCLKSRKEAFKYWLKR